MQLKRSTSEVLQNLSISFIDKTPLIDIFERTDFNNFKELDCPLFWGPSDKCIDGYNRGLYDRNMQQDVQLLLPCFESTGCPHQLLNDNGSLLKFRYGQHMSLSIHLTEEPLFGGV